MCRYFFHSVLMIIIRFGLQHTMPIPIPILHTSGEHHKNEENIFLPLIFCMAPCIRAFIFSHVLFYCIDIKFICLFICLYQMWFLFVRSSSSSSWRPYTQFFLHTRTRSNGLWRPLFPHLFGKWYAFISVFHPKKIFHKYITIGKILAIRPTIGSKWNKGTNERERKKRETNSQNYRSKWN